MVSSGILCVCVRAHVHACTYSHILKIFSKMIPLFVNILNKKLTKHTKSKYETKNSLKYTKTSSRFKNPHSTPIKT